MPSLLKLRHSCDIAQLTLLIHGGGVVGHPCLANCRGIRIIYVLVTAMQAIYRECIVSAAAVPYAARETANQLKKSRLLNTPKQQSVHIFYALPLLLLSCAPRRKHSLFLRTCPLAKAAKAGSLTHPRLKSQTRAKTPRCPTQS